ncbi:TPA: hypothetical protein N0F65_008282 [Lagenidium giganteum]|uniref:Cyclic nucleotide-binding domain-containing protein n=1 Tax=Lagenidium giganteum TaxID=4803 RepID=A0AAV2YT03_9STRA|nr:TPA: hypothetical protein N0F65_008282 [Lagenidium giganteum]
MAAPTMASAALEPSAPATPPPQPGANRQNAMQAMSQFRSTRRRTFLMELKDQMQLQVESESDREQQKEVMGLHRILQKAPETRDATDIDTLYEWVMKNGSTNKIFQGAQEIICKTICREMTLLEVPEKGVVCYQGDYGDIFFIIISGSVSLFVDPKRRPLQASSRGSTSDRTYGGRHSQHYLHHGVTDFEADRDVPQPESYGSFIKQIFAGGTFGELAVMDPTARRSCTIICDVATSFICLKRGAYQRLIRITNSSQLDFTQIEFLETLFFFDGWPHGELTRLSNRLRHLNFPADTFLTRVGSEANVVFFIYAGVVQESVTLVHYLNENGEVYKCSTVESESSKRSLQDAPMKDQQSRRRICLELNLYQDHDICGEYPILFGKALCNTDLLAVTDVKTLVMDRETWQELFFMHGVDHVREAHTRFRYLAAARENWRQTRTKLALANPGLVLTLSTKAMMQDGKCVCGWCGSKEHITGDLSCTNLIASKKKQADKQKSNNGKKNRKALEIEAKAQAIKNSIQFVNTLAESQQRKASAIAMGMQAGEFDDRQQRHGKMSISGRRKLTMRLVAQKIIEHKVGQEDPAAAVDAAPVGGQSPSKAVMMRVVTQKLMSLKDAGDPTVAAAAAAAEEPEAATAAPRAPLSWPSPMLVKANMAALEKFQSAVRVVPIAPVAEAPIVVAERLPTDNPVLTVRRGSLVTPVSATATVGASALTPQPPSARSTFVDQSHSRRNSMDLLLPPDFQWPPDEEATTKLPPLKADEVRRSAFADEVAAQYKQELVRKLKRVSSVRGYYEARGQVLEHLQEKDNQVEGSNNNTAAAAAAAAVGHGHDAGGGSARIKVARKPRIPKPMRRYCGKSHEPRPDRFNRKINRMLKKMWIRDHQLPVVEESLRDP